jgi:hypothetical protein
MTVLIGRSFSAVTALFLLPSPLTILPLRPCAQEGRATGSAASRSQLAVPSEATTTKRPARLSDTEPRSVAHATQRCPSCSRRALGRCPHRQRSRAYCFRSTYKLLMAGATTSTVTSPPPPSYTLASATAAADSSRPPPPPRLRSDSPLRLLPLILLIVSCGQMFNEMPLRRRCIWLMVLCCLLVCVADGGACRRRRWLL